MKLWIFISVKKRTIGGYIKNECKQAENYEEQWENSRGYYFKDIVETP